MESSISMPYLAEDEYLALEEASQGKYEYANGKIYAMAGASPQHDIIVNNLTLLIGMALRTSVCRTHTPDRRLKAGRQYYYPDLMVTCSREQQLAQNVTEPVLIFEVLSPSTAFRDHNEKREVYTTIASLQAYYLVSQDTPCVTAYERHGEQFRREIYTEGSVILPTHQPITLQLTDIYQQVF